MTGKISPWNNGQPSPNLTPHEKAYAYMVALSEGTLGEGDDGYNILVGSTPDHVVTFDSYDDHPRQRVWIENLHDYSTAAGRYQIMEWIYDAYKPRLRLVDFSPNAQDTIFRQLLKERHIQDRLAAGDVEGAIMAGNGGWASLPGAKYGQHTNRLDSLVRAYTTYFASANRPAVSPDVA